MSFENSSEGPAGEGIRTRCNYHLSDEFSNDTVERSSIQDSSLLLDTTPSPQEFDTPDISQEFSSSPNLSSFSEEPEPSPSSSSFESETADNILKKIRVKNVNKVIIGTLNINSLAPKFELLKEIIGKNIDILTIQETKLDSSFPSGQFFINGYSEPYRLDRDRNGGGVMIYVREDIPSKLLSKHTFSEAIEGLFVEVNLRKTKLLFFGSYRSDNAGLGQIEQLSKVFVGWGFQY